LKKKKKWVANKVERLKLESNNAWLEANKSWFKPLPSKKEKEVPNKEEEIPWEWYEGRQDWPDDEEQNALKPKKRFLPQWSRYHGVYVEDPDDFMIRVGLRGGPRAAFKKKCTEIRFKNRRKIIIVVSKKKWKKKN